MCAASRLHCLCCTGRRRRRHIAHGASAAHNKNVEDSMPRCEHLLGGACARRRRGLWQQKSWARSESPARLVLVSRDCDGPATRIQVSKSGGRAARTQGLVRCGQTRNGAHRHATGPVHALAPFASPRRPMGARCWHCKKKKGLHFLSCELLPLWVGLRDPSS